MPKTAVLGGGSWATALAVLLAGKGLTVSLWSRETDVVNEIKNTRKNSGYLPGVAIPEGVEVTGDIAASLEGATTIVFSVPSQAFREVLQKALPYIKPGALVVNVAKGIEVSSLKRLSEVHRELAPREEWDNYVLLSGPSHAEEVGRGIPTAVVSASVSRDNAEKVQDLFMGPRFRVYTNNDLLGVEMAGALKNVIALGTGISDGMGFGDNAKAALLTRGLAEITRLGKAMGARPITFAGLAGIGDLVVTCTSMHSRNRRAGMEIGQGKSTEEAQKAVGMVVEGITTAKAAYRLAQQYGVEMPITEEMHKVLFEGVSAREAVANLMLRGKTHETEDWLDTAFED